MDARIEELISKFEILGINPSFLQKKVGDIDDLKSQLKQAKDKTAALRPSDEDYPEQLAKHGQLWNTLTLQVAASETEIDQTISEAKQMALDRADKAIGKFTTATHMADEQIIAKLLEVYNLVQQRQEAATKQRAAADVLDGFCYDLGVNPNNWAPVLPGGKDIGNSVKDACAYILRRFARMVELRNLPGAEEDPVKWFDLRRPF